MFARMTRGWPREMTKWGAYVLLLLAPGSFVALPVLWLVRRYSASRSTT